MPSPEDESKRGNRILPAAGIEAAVPGDPILPLKNLKTDDWQGPTVGHSAMDPRCAFDHLRARVKVRRCRAANLNVRVHGGSVKAQLGRFSIARGFWMAARSRARVCAACAGMARPLGCKRHEFYQLSNRYSSSFGSRVMVQYSSKLKGVAETTRP